MTTIDPISTVEAPAPDLGLAGYQLRLPGFEGPLDVLLRLIERQQLPITAVSLVDVTDQFLAYLTGLDAEVPPAVIAEFAAVGARLTLLKSRSLLPRPPRDDDEGDASDLVRQLVEYRAVRDAATHLAERDRLGMGAFVRAGGLAHGLPKAEPARLASYAPQSLARAIRRHLSVVPRPAELMEARPMVSLREMVHRITESVAGGRVTRFDEITGDSRSRPEIQTAFLALLVLVRRRVVDAEQDETFGAIRLRANASMPAEFATGLPGDVTADFDEPAELVS